MMIECRIGEALEVTSRSLLEILSLHFPWEAEENHENLCQDRWDPGRSLNQTPPEYKSKVSFK
jgi:hypothetical protein